MLPSKPYTPLVLIILDGFGIAPPGPGNAITLAHTPTLDALKKSFPYTTLKASGEDVGLRPLQDGNSEAGHLNIGAGRIVPQDLVRVNKAIKDGTFFKNPAFESAVLNAKKRGRRVHMMGLLSDDQSAHASPMHIRALLKYLRSHDMAPVLLHLFTDGRDTHQFAGITFVKMLQKELQEHERIATIAGRYWGMDRKKEWCRTERAYAALACGTGITAASPDEAVTQAYARGESDEFIQPTVITHRGKPLGTIQEEDSIIFFNARSDRARQLTKAFVQKRFNEMNPGAFVRCKVFHALTFVALTDFGPDLGEILTAFPSPDLKDTLPMALKSYRQLYIAETDKYAHLTYFFNGGYANPVGGEHRVLVQSPSVPSYDQAPAMAAKEITAVVEQNINKQIYDILVINFANPDMVGHTGNLPATVKAVETVDGCVRRIMKAVERAGGLMCVTADHGNAEEVIDVASGVPDTEHSKNEVPFMIADWRKKEKGKRMHLQEGGRLADVAPTILELLGEPIPEAMTGKSLVKYSQ